MAVSTQFLPGFADMALCGPHMCVVEALIDGGAGGQARRAAGRADDGEHRSGRADEHDRWRRGPQQQWWPKEEPGGIGQAPTAYSASHVVVIRAILGSPVLARVQGSRARCAEARRAEVTGPEWEASAVVTD